MGFPFALIVALGFAVGSQDHGFEWDCVAAAGYSVRAVQPGPQPHRSSGVLPALIMPISSLEVAQIALDMGLSEEQRRRVHDAHESYKSAFSAVREAHFDEYVGLFHAVALLPRQTPSTKTVKQYVRKYRALEKEIGLLDARFFEVIGDIAGGAAGDVLARVRTHRERTQLLVDPMMSEWFVNKTFVDVAAIFESVPLEGQLRELARGELDAYSFSLTKVLRNLHSATLSMREDWGELVKTDDRLGLAGDDADSVHSLRATLETAKAWAPVAAITEPIVEQYRKLNRSMYKKLERTLPVRLRREFRRRYLTAEYGRSLRREYSVERIFEAAAYRDALDDETVAIIRERLVEHQKKLGDLEDRDIRRIEDDRRRRVPGMRNVRLGPPPERRRRPEVREVELRREAIEFLQTTLGAEIVRELLSNLDARNDAGGRPPGWKPAGEPTHTKGAGRDRYKQELAALNIRSRISTTSIARYARMLELSDDQRELLDLLYAEYSKAYSRLDEHDFQKLRKIKLGATRREREDGTIRFGVAAPTEVERAYSLLKHAESAVSSLHTRFFEDLELGVLDNRQAERLWRVRLDHLAELAAAKSRSDRGLGSREASVNVVRVVDEAGVSDEEAVVIEDLLQTASREIMSLLRELMETRAEAWNAFWMERAWSDREFAANREMREESQVARQDAEHRLRELRGELVRKLREIMSSIGRSVGEESAMNLAQRYCQAAFPDVFAWRETVVRRLGSALEHGGLLVGDRTRLEELVLELRKDCDAICEQMISVHRRWDDVQMRSDELEVAKLAYEMDQLDFDREELERKVTRELQPILGQNPLKPPA